MITNMDIPFARVCGPINGVIIMRIKSIVSSATLGAATLLSFTSVPTVAVSVLVPLALVPTPAGAQPYFSRSTLGPNFGIQQPRTPSYAPSYGPATSSPSVQGDCEGCGSGKLPGNLSGVWSVTYPQGPLRVQVVHRGRTLVATLIEGNIAVPAGKVAVQSNAVARIFAAQQICAYPGYIGARFVGARFTVADSGKSMTEVASGCGLQSRVEWTKIQ
jgi:hypothetical protein